MAIAAALESVEFPTPADRAMYEDELMQELAFAQTSLRNKEYRKVRIFLSRSASRFIDATDACEFALARRLAEHIAESSAHNAGHAGSTTHEEIQCTA